MAAFMVFRENRTYVISTWVIMRTDVLEDLGLLRKHRI